MKKPEPFLATLQHLLRIDTQPQFSDICDKREQNMSRYLKKDPTRPTLEDCLLNATLSRVFKNTPDEHTPFGRKVRRARNDIVSDLLQKELTPVSEVAPIPKRPQDLPHCGGVYILYDSAANVLYIGKVKSFRAEVWQTLKRRIPVGMRFGPSMRETKPLFADLACHISLYRIDNKNLRHAIEGFLIRIFVNQTHNRRIGQIWAR